MIKALIFDFDGLIFDSETPDYLSWKAVYEAMGVALPLSVWHTNIGAVDLFNPYEYLETELGHAIDRVAVHARRKELDNHYLSQQTIRPGVIAWLDMARQLGLKTAVASSSPHSWVDEWLAKLELRDYFTAVRCRDDVGNRGKPAPDVYLAALAALGVDAVEAIALEDSPNGLLAARRAGLSVIVVPNQMTAPLDFPGAYRRLESLTDLPLPQLLADFQSGNGAGMSNAQRIREFHAAMGFPQPAAPQLPTAAMLQMRQKLIDEEYAEVTAVFTEMLTAMENEQQPDITALVHELTDLLYVAYGAIQACGVDPDPVFAEVHRANMQKRDGPRRADGKVLKPKDWQPADVAGVIGRLKR